MVDERSVAERVPAAMGDAALPGQELTALAESLGISEETARLIGEDTCAQVELRLSNLSRLRTLCRIEPQVFNPNSLRINDVREETYVSTGERLADAVEKYDERESALMARANHGKISHKGIRIRAGVRDTIDRLVPRLKDSAVPTDLGQTAMKDVETVKDVVHAGLDCLGSLPRPTKDPTPDEFLDQLEAIGDQLAGLVVVDPSTLNRINGILNVERAASAVELLYLMEPEPRMFMLPDTMVAAWTGQAQRWLEAREVARTFREYTETGPHPEDMAVIPLNPIEVPDNEIYRSTDSIRGDQAKIKDLEAVNGQLRDLADEVLRSFRGSCSNAATRELGQLMAAVCDGLERAETELEADIDTDIDPAGSPYDLLPRGRDGNIDPRHIRFVQQAQQGTLLRYQTVKQELDSLIERTAHAWPETVRRGAVAAAEPMPAAAPSPATVQLSRQEASALIKNMATALQEASAAPVARVLSGKPTKKTKTAATAGNAEAVEEMHVRRELRDSCGFDQQSIGVIVSIVQGEWPHLIDAQAVLANRYHHVAAIAAATGNPNLLANHPLQSLTTHNFGTTLTNIRTCLDKAGDKINGALSTPQMYAVRAVLSEYGV